DIRKVTPLIFQVLDVYSGPRLVEYWDEDPCQPRGYYDFELSQKAMAPAAAESASDKAEGYHVKIEAHYTADEYDIFILSAKESNGLERWLTDNGYRIPLGAKEVLEPYIKSGMKFFVVKVNIEELQKKENDFLSPL